MDLFKIKNIFVNTCYLYPVEFCRGPIFFLIFRVEVIYCRKKSMTSQEDERCAICRMMSYESPGIHIPCMWHYEMALLASLQAIKNTSNTGSYRVPICTKQAFCSLVNNSHMICKKGPWNLVIRPYMASISYASSIGFLAHDAQAIWHLYLMTQHWWPSPKRKWVCGSKRVLKQKYLICTNKRKLTSAEDGIRISLAHVFCRAFWRDNVI